MAMGAGGLGFDFGAGQMAHCCKRLATDATFLCCPSAQPGKWVLPLLTRFGVIPPL